jgi:hypothetical protein
MAYRGETVSLPVGAQGFNGSRNPSKMGPGHWSYVEGVDYDGGVLVKDGGAEPLNASALGGGASILAGTNWSPSGGLYNDIVFLDNGDVMKDTGAGTFATTVASGLDTPTVYPPSWSTGGGETVGAARKLFLFNEANQVQVLPGTSNTMADIDTPAADWVAAFPIGGCLHDLRLWAYGVATDPHRLYYTAPGDHEDFPAGGTLSIYPGEGEMIVACTSFRGLLLVFKRPKGIYVVDTRDPTPANWQVQKLNTAVGAAGPLCLNPISNDLMFLDKGGNFHLMSAVQDFGDINTSNIGQISDISAFMRAEVSLANIQQSNSGWYAAKSKAWFMVPTVGSIMPDLRIVIDFADPQVGPRFTLSRRDIGVSLWMRPNAQGVEKPTLGDDEGFVWLMDEEERNKDGAAYDFAFDTADTDFSFAAPELASKSKTGNFLEIVSDVINETELSVTPVWDGQPSTPINFSFGGAGAALGSFVLDVDALAAAGIVTSRRKLDGSGRRLKLVVENTALDDEVRISEFRVSFNVGDERTSQ